MMTQDIGHATLLKGGQIVDGSDSPGWLGDVLLSGQRIVSVAAPGETSPELLASLRVHGVVEEIDCSGMVIAPGFIDVHTHDDAAAIEKADMLPKLSQGVTTVIVGNCGISLAP